MAFQSLDFRTATCAPFAVIDKNGKVLDLQEVLSHLKEEVTTITNAVELCLTHELKDELRKFIDENPKKAKASSSGLSWYLNIKYPEEFLLKGYGKSGKARLNDIFGAKLVDLLKSWIEREKAVTGESDKYISAGWRRTMNANKPQNLAPSIDLSNADKNYSFIEIQDDLLILTMVVKGNWYKFLFETDERFKYVHIDKIALPEIFLNPDGNVRFSFPLGYKQQRPSFSPEYVIGVDVGINTYATAVVVNIKTGEVVETTTLSQHVHSLTNKIRNANMQVASLRKKFKHHEAALHRAKNSNRKKSLAIEAAREIAELSAKYGNALVAVEDLSWINNTMQNGRWNRGELVDRLTHKVELNGGRVMRIRAYNTSQNCHKCNEQVSFFEWEHVICNNCGMTGNRDENAAVNIAKRLLSDDVFDKSCKTRKKGKGAKKQQINKLKRSQKFIDRISTVAKTREKNKPTPKRVTKALDKFKKEFIAKQVQETKQGVNKDTNIFSSALDNKVRVALDVSVFASEQPCMIVTDSTKEKYLSKKETTNLDNCRL